MKKSSKKKMCLIAIIHTLCKCQCSVLAKGGFYQRKLKAYAGLFSLYFAERNRTVIRKIVQGKLSLSACKNCPYTCNEIDGSSSLQCMDKLQICSKLSRRNALFNLVQDDKECLLFIFLRYSKRNKSSSK